MVIHSAGCSWNNSSGQTLMFINLDTCMHAYEEPGIIPPRSLTENETVFTWGRCASAALTCRRQNSRWVCWTQDWYLRVRSGAPRVCRHISQSHHVVCTEFTSDHHLMKEYISYSFNLWSQWQQLWFNPLYYTCSCHHNNNSILLKYQNIY